MTGCLRRFVAMFVHKPHSPLLLDLESIKVQASASTRPQALIQDFVLKWRSSKGSSAGGEGSSDLDSSGGPSLVDRLRSLSPFHSPARQGQGPAFGERSASLAKLGSSRAAMVEREASLLGPARPRSDAPNMV